MSEGYVYILGNEYMPGTYKIGKTTRTPEQRAAELYQTGVPFPFDVVFSVFVPDCDYIERAIHDQYEGYRCDPSREFFSLESGELLDAINDLQFFQRQLLDQFVERYLPNHTISEPVKMIEKVVYPLKLVGSGNG